MGYLSISASNGASGTSFTNWKNFENMIQKWESAGADVLVESEVNFRPTKVIAKFTDGVTRWASYSPSYNELEN
jgi:hypothetical protein